jgi:phosphoribosyl 1,2-cyclic phosphodiesterase
MPVKVSVLGSGSRGNATFIKTEQVRLLIDAGMSRRETARRLESIGEDPDGIDAVLITHEHTDHAGGLRTLLKELPAKAYMTWGTSRSLQADEYELNGSSIILIQPGTTFVIGDVQVTSVRVPSTFSDRTS